jgi:hypothetical protein
MIEFKESEEAELWCEVATITLRSLIDSDEVSDRSDRKVLTKPHVQIATAYADELVLEFRNRAK